MCHARGTMLCSSGLKSANGWAYVTPTSLSAAAPARIAANASFGPAQTTSARRRSGGASGSDLGGASADELGNVPGGHDHGVHPGALELGHVVAAADGELRDRELSCRHVLEEVERALQGVLVLLVTCCEQKDLRVEPLQHLLELFLVANLHRALQAELERTAVGRFELPVLVVQLAERQDAGVRLRCLRALRRAGRAPEQRQAGRLPNLAHRRMQCQRLGSLLLRGTCRFRSVDRHDYGDAVALGDGLAEASRPGHVLAILAQTAARSLTRCTQMSRGPRAPGRLDPVSHPEAGKAGLSRLTDLRRPREPCQVDQFGSMVCRQAARLNEYGWWNASSAF